MTDCATKIQRSSFNYCCRPAISVWTTSCQHTWHGCILGFYSNVTTFTFGSLLSKICLSSVTFVRPTQGLKFWTIFFTILYLSQYSHPLTSVQKFTEIVPSPPLRSRTPLLRLGGCGSARTPAAGCGADPQPKLNLVHFSLKI